LICSSRSQNSGFIYCIFIKDITKEADEEMNRARHIGRGVVLPCPLQACYPPVFRKPSEPHLFGYLWKLYGIGMTET
jgi:hypothetical protein